MAEQTFTKCPTCGAEVSISGGAASRTKSGLASAAGGALVGGTYGANYGKKLGIAGRGGARSGEVVFGALGAVVGGLAFGAGGLFSADWAAAKVTCEDNDCQTRFRIQS